MMNLYKCLNIRILAITILSVISFNSLASTNECANIFLVNSILIQSGMHVIKPLVSELDIQKVSTMLSDKETTNGALGAFPEGLTPQSYFTQMANHIVQKKEDLSSSQEPIVYLVIKNLEEVVGLVSLTSLKYDPKHYEYFKLTPGTLNTWFKLGIILSPKVWGQGVAKQSIDLVSNYLFQHSNAIGIYAKVKNTNEKSISFFNNSEFKKINLSFDLVSTHYILETDK